MADDNRKVNVFSLNKDLTDFKNTVGEALKAINDKLDDIATKPPEKSIMDMTPDEVEKRGLAPVEYDGGPQTPESIPNVLPLDVTETMIISPKTGERIVNPLKQEYSNLSPQWQVLFEKYFDPRDGFTTWIQEVTLNKRNNPNSPRLLWIDVPERFSNAGDAHWGYYKNDRRSIPLITNAPTEAEAFYKKVAKNLHYDKNLAYRISK